MNVEITEKQDGTGTITIGPKSPQCLGKQYELVAGSTGNTHAGANTACAESL